MTFSENIIHSVPGLLCIIDENFNFIKGNRNFMNFFNIDANNLSNVSPLSMFVGNEKEKMKKMMEEAFKTGHENVETVMTVNDSKYHYFINAKLFEQNGKKYLIGYGIDISDRVRVQENNRVLLQEVHHRVKNNLAIISGLLQLEMEKLENLQLQLTLQRSINRIHSMAKVHELLYSSSNFATIDIKRYFEEIVSEIKHTFDKGQGVQIQFDIEDLKMNVNVAIPLGMLLNELLTNSIKYAFKGKDAQIHIAISEADNHYRFLYQDNGKGLEKQPDLQKPSTLGMSIISALLQQLEAEYTLEVEDKFALKFEFEQKLKGAYSGLPYPIVKSESLSF